MPSVIQGATYQNLTVTNLGYEDSYPLGMNLKPGSKLHDKIVTEVNKLADSSWEIMSKRYASWKAIDQTLSCYISTDTYEQQLKQKDDRKPISIVVPYSYSVLESMLAYLVRQYLTGNLFYFDGWGPEDTIPAKLLELCCEQQAKYFKTVLDIHTNWRDGFAYGFGASAVSWARKWGKKPLIKESPIYSPYGAITGMDKSKINVDALLFEGNDLSPIDPYRCLPDPNTSIHNIEGMNFFGWLEFTPLNSLLAEESNGETYFNVKYLKQNPYAGRTSKYGSDESGRIDNKTATDVAGNTKQVCKMNMYVEVIPKEWGLKSADPSNKDGEYPEKWFFTIANDNLVIRALPLGLNHNRFPILTIAPDYDGYSATPISRMEIINGLQTALNWMFNAHVTNVRKAINDMLIVDPSLINMEDLADPEPGKLIRLRRSAWGRGVENAVKQLQIVDITRNNMADAALIMDMMGRTSGASDPMQGRQRTSGERVSAAEFTGTLQNAVSRVDKVGFLSVKQYFYDLSYFFASHTQQFMSQETYVKAVGDWPLELMEEFGKNGIAYGDKVKVDPFSIVADYDINFKDQTTPSAEALTNDFWTKSFQTIGGNPQLSQMFDVVRIFMQMARLNGAKNVNEFVRKGGANFAQYPTEDVVQQAQAGNLVPINETMQMGG